MKKNWSKPELIVLYRGAPEVNVLQACKYGGNSGPNSGACTGGGECIREDGETGACCERVSS